jgi:hypothetical protein
MRFLILSEVNMGRGEGGKKKRTVITASSTGITPARDENGRIIRVRARNSVGRQSRSRTTTKSPDRITNRRATVNTGNATERVRRVASRTGYSEAEIQDILELQKRLNTENDWE